MLQIVALIGYLPRHETIFGTLGFAAAARNHRLNTPISQQRIALQIQHGERNIPVSLAIVQATSTIDPQAGTVLHPAEIQRASALTATLRRQSYLLGRLAAKTALTDIHPANSPETYAITTGHLGQPLLDSPDTSQTRISIAHTSQYGAALAYPAHTPMGLDIEELRENVGPNKHGEIAYEQCNNNEKQQIAQSALDPHQGALLLWCMKESLAKTLGCGLAVDFAIYALDQLRELDGIWQGSFQHFHALHAQAFFTDALCVAITLPIDVRLRRPV